MEVKNGEGPAPIKTPKGCIHLIYNQHNSFFIFFAPFIKNPEYIIQIYLLVSASKFLKLFIVFIRNRNSHTVPCITKNLRKALRKLSFVHKICIGNILKININHIVLR